MTDFIRRRPLVSAIVAFVLLFVLLGSFPIVPETKQAVVVRFGKPVRILNRYAPGSPIGSPGAGISWRIPFAEQVVWIDKRVQNVDMQRILDGYRSGIQIQGIAIKQADPPDAVNDAFKQVTAAQQDAQTYINNANAYSLQLRQKSQGEATAFDKVYEQYKLAPEVTRRRMYYETMEDVLSKVDKTVIQAPGVTPYLPLPQIQKTQPQERAQ